MERGAFSNEEKLDMLTCCILCQRNCIAAANLYENKYPERNQPGHSIFRRLFHNLKEYGAFKKPTPTRNKTSNEEKQLTVLQSVVEIPTISTRKIERNTGIAKSTAHFVLKKSKYKPFKFRVCQGLRSGDDNRRLAFCEWYTRQCQGDANFPFKVLWSDESMVTNNGIFNRRNTHYWSQENPRKTKDSRYQHRFGFNIWLGILGTRILGPFIYHGSLTSERYLNLLRNDLEENLESLPLGTIRNCWFQQDGAPAHNSREVRQYLYEQFPGRCIATYGDVLWSPRSPDLTPLDFFMWGYLKNYVYERNFENEVELQDLVNEAINSITPHMLVNVLNSTVRRAYLCMENSGQIFEHML